MRPKLLREYPKFVYLGKSSEYEGAVHLRCPSWDCGWYWGFGYIQRWNSISRDIDFHSHLDSVLFHTDKNCLAALNTVFDKGFVLKTDKKKFQFLDLVKTIYHFREMAEVYRHGGSFISGSPLGYDVVRNDDEYRRINYEVLPKLIDELYKLLGV